MTELITAEEWYDGCEDQDYDKECLEALFRDIQRNVAEAAAKLVEHYEGFRGYEVVECAQQIRAMINDPAPAGNETRGGANE